MLKAATWQAMIGQPPPRGRSGTHMSRVIQVLATYIKSCHVAGCDWTAADVAKVGPTCHVSSMWHPHGAKVSLRGSHVAADVAMG
ncbi:hypothetical protein Tco_0908505 [Tanacetum coccineum]|uniref:Uncharacterized protein n=1 Tax=Tanacetum coccineum TaxID=301880 RepID=A0ABQ5CMD7_9ASTR